LCCSFSFFFLCCRCPWLLLRCSVAHDFGASLVDSPVDLSCSCSVLLKTCSSCRLSAERAPSGAAHPKRVAPGSLKPESVLFFPLLSVSLGGSLFVLPIRSVRLGLELQQEFFSSRAAACRHQSLNFHLTLLLLPVFVLLNLSSSPSKILECVDCLQVNVGLVLESPDQKTR
jgi:hypothetical protein